MLRLEGVSSGYAESMVLRGLNLTVPRASIVALLGKNGMGKTTLLKAAMGFLPKRAGRVFIDGHDVTREPAHRIARGAVSYTPQEQALFGDLGIRDNLRLGLARDAELSERMADIIELFPFLEGRDAQRCIAGVAGKSHVLCTFKRIGLHSARRRVDEPHMRHPFARVNVHLDGAIDARGAWGKHFADPIGHDRKAMALRDLRHVPTVPTREIWDQHIFVHMQLHSA